jgi:Tfp pilus assembly protein PilV
MPHFTSFTPEAMTAFGQELAADLQQRLELLAANRSHTHDLLASARTQLQEMESQRRQSAAQAADARRLFTSELRSGVHALCNRFELARRDMAADLQQMAGELNAAREAFHNRPGHTAAAGNARPSGQGAKSRKRH